MIDCQSDLLSGLSTRFVVPLTPLKGGAEPVHRLNPVFSIGGEAYVMRTQFAATVRRQQLGAVVDSLDGRAFDVVGAVDTLISGI